MLQKYALSCCIALCLCYACQPNSPQSLPIMGERKTVQRTTADGKTVVDTIYHQIRNFSLLDQDSQRVSKQTVAGKVYVADFFFTSCPTICPLMKTQMLRVAEHYRNEPRLAILSHTIDPEYDTIPRLREYAEQLGVDNPNWHFLWGKRDTIFALAEQDYYVSAMVDANSPGGYAHSGGFILVDNQGRVRGVFDGTQAKPVDSLMQAIDQLLLELPTPQ